MKTFPWFWVALGGVGLVVSGLVMGSKAKATTWVTNDLTLPPGVTVPPALHLSADDVHDLQSILANTVATRLTPAAQGIYNAASGSLWTLQQRIGAVQRVLNAMADPTTMSGNSHMPVSQAMTVLG